jgi:uncharacterized membrane protein
LRLYGLAYRDLWFDELGAVALATTGDLWANEGGNPPLFFGLLRLWSDVAGTSISALRLLSAIPGAASVAAIFWVAAELRLPVPARWWSAVLLTVSPLHLYYSQETRAYAWLVLLVLVALGTFLRAIRTNERRWWLAHAGSLTAGLYTHNMMLPVTCAFWAAALAHRLEWRQWRMLGVAHLIAGAAYMPWTIRLWQQVAGDSHAWIADLIRGASGRALVLGSLEAFSPGGLMPGYLEFPATRGTEPWAFLIYGTFAVFVVIAGIRALVRPATSDAPAASLLVLLIFTAAPLLFLLAYTWREKPLYLVGRYDLPALPPDLLLMAIGLHSLTLRLRVAGRVAALLPAFAVAIVAVAALTPKLALGNSAVPQHPSVRLAAMLQRWAEPGDVIVALDVTGTLASYAAARSGTLTVKRFPAASLSHLGEAALNDVVTKHESSFRQEAAALAGMLRDRRAWLVGTDIYQDETARGYPRLKLLLMSELRHHTPRRDQRTAGVGDMYVAVLEPRK